VGQQNGDAVRQRRQNSNGRDGDEFFRLACRLVVLTKDGQVDQSIDELVIAVLGQSYSHTTVEDVISTVRSTFGVILSRSLVAESLRRLHNGNRVRSLRTSGEYTLTDKELASFKERLQDATVLERTVRSEWLSSLECGPVEPTSELGQVLWTALLAYLGRAFRRHAAETAMLLNPASAPETDIGRTLASILHVIASEYYPSEPTVVIASINEFFRSPSPERIRYLAQVLDGAFAVSALSVDRVAADYLQATLEPLTIFLDTNFIYGVLGLHDNPYVDISNELLEILQTNKFPFTLAVHPDTVNEFVRSLERARSVLVGRDWKPELSRVLMNHEELTGIERRYHRENAEKPTDPEAFLLSYEAVQVRLSSIGATVYTPLPNPSPDQQQTRVHVAQYGEYLKGKKDKGPASLEHDIAVWEEVQRIQKGADGLLNCKALFLTTDHHFFSFDWTKLRAPGRFGSSVMPNHLLQLLRPFVPMTDDFNRRFVETFALPEFRIIDSQASRIASKIASYLATFSNLDPMTASGLISNGMLRDKLRGLEHEPVLFMEAIDQEIGLENRALGLERDQFQRQTEELTAQVKALQNQLVTLSAVEEASVVKHSESDRVISSETAAIEEVKPEPSARPGTTMTAAEAVPQTHPSHARLHRRIESVLIAAVIVLAELLLWNLLYQQWSGLNHKNGVLVAGATLAFVVAYSVGQWPPRDLGWKMGVLGAILIGAGIVVGVVD
jgi:hypothetical protein